MRSVLQPVLGYGGDLWDMSSLKRKGYHKDLGLSARSSWREAPGGEIHRL